MCCFGLGHYYFNCIQNVMPSLKKRFIDYKTKHAFFRFLLTSGILAMPQSKSARSVYTVSNCDASRVYRMFWVLPSVTARRSSSVFAWSIPTANTVTPSRHTRAHTHTKKKNVSQNRGGFLDLYV